mmetsp:Transcript_37507/g.60959  ORF Transcript_37507/g.60959 Transcript_37507/m.60959 type:complete len:118 (+) Transcript_37507:607-960(+)
MRTQPKLCEKDIYSTRIATRSSCRREILPTTKIIVVVIILIIIIIVIITITIVSEKVSLNGGEIVSDPTAQVTKIVCDMSKQRLRSWMSKYVRYNNDHEKNYGERGLGNPRLHEQCR